MEKKLSKVQATVTIIVATLGNGTLYMPLAFVMLGYVGGTIAIISIAVFTFFSLYCLLYIAHKSSSPTKSYPEIAVLASPFLKFLVDLSLVCSGVATMASTFIKCSSQLRNITGNYPVSILLMLFLSPFCVMRKIVSLKAITYFAISAVIYLALLVTLLIFKFGTINTTFKLQPIGNDIYSGISYFIFALQCQFAICNVYDEMEDQSMDAVVKTISSAIFLSSLMYLLIGLGSYKLLGNSIDSIITEAFRSSLLLARVKSDTFDKAGLSVHFSIVSLMMVLVGSFILSGNSAIPILERRFFGDQKSLGSRMFIVVPLLSAILFAELFLKINVDKMMALVSAVFTNALGFIFPFLFFYILEAKSASIKALCLFSVAASIILMVSKSLTSISEIFA